MATNGKPTTFTRLPHETKPKTRLQLHMELPKRRRCQTSSFLGALVFVGSMSICRQVSLAGAFAAALRQLGGRRLSHQSFGGLGAERTAAASGGGLAEAGLPGVTDG